ncbi:hypothetical protein [Microbacterium sp. 10M-3C3]|jgi:hypothetical protein|uniref:hypothetical protein n=1 Tax=Microbacterium sp. 10M-3C3 TaxID=2483401 RepID=UPI000F6356AA|nr:hypothetical protein [Microbacterium sp. 10M-3C3]
MRFARSIGSIFVAAAAVALLSGCAAADPDVSGLQAELNGLPGVNGSQVVVEHPGAPWNTRIVVNMYLDDPSQATVVSVVEAAAPALADDEAVRQHPVSIFFVDGQVGDFPAGPKPSRTIPLSNDTYAALGLTPAAGRSLELTPDDLRRLAGRG